MIVFSLLQKEVEAELDRLVGQEGTIHTKMLALQRMGYSLKLILISLASEALTDEHLIELKTPQFNIFKQLLSLCSLGPTFS